VANNIKQRIVKLLRNPNIWRAGIFYGTTLLIGAIGFFAIGGAVGWYFLTCWPGFGTGVALALLSNGHKKPVTFGSVASTIGMTIALTFIMWLLNAPIFAALVGWGCSVVGGACGLWFCNFDNKRAVKQDMTEMIDIFDADMNKVGEMEKYEAHKKHQWHKNAHVWVTDGKNVLVQKRAACKKTLPNKWDISSAGHFNVGDTPLQCAKREWSEELGLPWEFGDVEPDFMKAWGLWDGEPVYEFIYFFLLKGKPELDKVKLQAEEVAAVKWLSFEEFKEKIKTDSFCPYGDEYWGMVVERLSKLMD